jgi:hypothetical protein
MFHHGSAGMGDLAYTRPPFCQPPKYVIFRMEQDLLPARIGLRHAMAMSARNDGDQEGVANEQRAG